MSRRRPKPRPSAVPGKKAIRIVCTDRGQHAEVLFDTVDVWPDDSVPGGWFVALPQATDDDYTPPLGAREAEDLVRDATGQLYMPSTYDPFKCRRCGRNVPLKRETLIRACPKLASLGGSRLDISYVP